MAEQIPWQCWDAPGFKTCHAQRWEESRQKCATYAPDKLNECIDLLTTEAALDQCVQLCPILEPSKQARSQDRLSTAAKIMGAALISVIVVAMLRKE